MENTTSSAAKKAKIDSIAEKMMDLWKHVALWLKYWTDDRKIVVPIHELGDTYF